MIGVVDAFLKSSRRLIDSEMDANTVNTLLRCCAGLLIAVLLTGCETLNPPKPGDSPEYRPVAPPEPRPAAANNGAIFQPSVGAALFEDHKANRVGDILTVILNERTNAKKSSATSLSKDSSASMDFPDVTVAGRPLLNKGGAILGLETEAGRTFDGAGNAAQSNQFSGEITVSVAEVLPNGNLIIQGEKWLGINQGNEYLRLRGIVRQVDISPYNTIPSTQIANVELYYGGTGALRDSNTPGWLSRFFTSPIWPI